MILAALQQLLSQPDFSIAGTFRSWAVSAVESLDDIDRVLVQRGLLPSFTLP